ncbi:MAG: ABC transporter ATP-binding protein [Spirochaetes bacterium]|nr:ABC transporter ATP-binding protein [Spirochaetota bacterium]MBN2771490.1 ABC transporter ATP-binding protein [Spirochaetota bacterium]
MKKNKQNISLLKVENIKLKFGSRMILSDVNFSVEPGTITVITGKSGCGKTTLLGIISGLLKPNDGKVYFKGKNILRWGDIRRSFYRSKNIGFIFQFFNLLNDYSAFENILLPTMFNPFARNASKKAKELIEYLNLKAISSNHPETLSGGERQRIAIARAVINNPDIILADEPTGNLDDESAEDINNLFIKLAKENNKAFVIVTHDHRIVENSDFHYHLSDTALVLQTKTKNRSKKPAAKKPSSIAKIKPAGKTSQNKSDSTSRKNTKKAAKKTSAKKTK